MTLAQLSLSDTTATQKLTLVMTACTMLAQDPARPNLSMVSGGEVMKPLAGDLVVVSSSWEEKSYFFTRMHALRGYTCSRRRLYTHEHVNSIN